MDQPKTFCFNNSLLDSPPHNRFQDIFNITHHFVTGEYHNGKAGVDFLNNLTTGELTSMVLSNTYISGIFSPGDYMFGLRDKHYRIWVGIEDQKQTIYYNTNYKKKLKFEDCVDIIDNEIQKRKAKWHLTAVQWLDYDDISQILRLHIYKKFDMWDQSRTIEPWLNVIISHQISNLLRNNYGNYSRPCLKCSANEGGNLCSIYATQCNSCPLYKRWSKTKKQAYDSKLPLPLEHHSQEVYDKPNVSIDVEKGIKTLDHYMKGILKPIEYKVFKYLYVDGGKEDKIAKILGFKTTEKGRSAGYRQLKNLKDSITEKVKKAVYNNEIDF